MALETPPQDSISYEIALKLRDLEENQKLSKERLLLIGGNLIDSQEKNNSEITDLKKNIQELNDDVKRLKSIISGLSEEVSKSARKEDIAILTRQYKMFQPLEYARHQDVEKIIDKKLHHHSNDKEDKEKDFWTGKL